MADVKRWSATYTKHVKQKRKVYQDGFLELHISTNKVMLYDDCEKLLECRILNKDEAVSCGETLTFNAYLIDVGDPEGDHKPVPGLNSQGRDEKIVKKPSLLHGQKFRNHSVSFEDRKKNVEVNKARLTLSPSRKIIREFKKSELHKYKAPQSSPETTKPNLTEWQVLYTTQVTQKAKKYHDGFLRLATCGSLGRQVILFDESRKLLNSRFLKKDEVIRSGESIAFDGHLVEVGELDGDHKPLIDLNVQGNNLNVKKNGIMHGQENCVNFNKPVGQVFKNSELDKYGAPESGPDTANPGLTGQFVLLYDADRKLLDSRFLKKDEVIRSGESIAFNAHLIEIGEPEGNNKSPADLIHLNAQGNKGNINRKSGLMHGQQDSHKDRKSVVKEWHSLYTSQITQKAKKYHNGILKVAFCGSFRMQVTLLNEDKSILSSKFLSLSEDVRTGSMLELPKYLVEVGEPCVSPQGALQNNAHSEKDVDSNFSISSVDEIKLSKRVPINKPLRDAHKILSFLQKPMVQDSNVAGYMDDSKIEPTSSTKGHQVSDVVILDFPEDGRPLRASLQCHELSQNPCSDKVEADTKWCEGAVGKSSLTAPASHGPIDNVRKTSTEHTCTREINECPSFDLGF
uniref:5'-3' DNA helicase ZGRF1-like N-terminal domain-containing protein n=1 Tax=Fagus sylvatica TaxID=28930 RepID=A0A2N9H892_FAGSY